MKAFAARKDFEDRSRLRTLCLGRLLCHVPAKASTEIFMAFQLQKKPATFASTLLVLAATGHPCALVPPFPLGPKVWGGRPSVVCVGMWGEGGLGGNGFSAIELLAYGCKGVNQDLSTTARSGRI